MAAVGPGWAIGLDGVTYVVSAAFLLRLRPAAFLGRAVTADAAPLAAIASAADGLSAYAAAGAPAPAQAGPRPPGEARPRATFFAT